MVCGAGKNIWTPPRNSGRIPSTRFSVIYRENEQADKRRYSQTCLAKPNSQARTGARKFSPVQLTINRIGNLTQLICTLLYVMTTHTCIRILYCRVYPQLPPVIGAPWGLKKNLNAFVAGTLRGYFLPVRYGSVGVQLTRLRALYQGTLTSGCVWKNLNTSYLYNAAILASFFLFACLKACVRLSLSTRNKKKRTITSKKHAYRPETSYVLYYSLKERLGAVKLAVDGRKRPNIVLSRIEIPQKKQRSSTFPFPVCRSASSLFTYEISNGESNDLDQCLVRPCLNVEIESICS